MHLLNSSFVVTGSGFTPQIVSEGVLASIFEQPAEQVITTPLLAVADFQGGYHVNIRESRLEVRHDNPADGSDKPLQNAVVQLLKFWPLLRPAAIGINFAMGFPYDDPSQHLKLAASLSNVYRVQEILGADILGTTLVFTAMRDESRIQVKVTTDALVAERVGVVVDCNIHHEKPASIEPIVAQQGDWFAIASTWAKELTHGD
jgi:hypothetical protein